MVWGLIIALSAAASAFLIYALWPWATGRQPRAAYRAGVIGLGLAILAGPLTVYYRSTLEVPPPVDLPPAMQGDTGKGFVWGGPIGTSNPPPQQVDTSLETLTAGLAKKLESQPDNINGWVLLARSYVALGHVDKARTVYSNLTAKWPKNVEIKVAYGEMLMAAADGRVTPEARKAFEAAAAADPKHPRAQYDLALADSQQGKDKAAYDRWLRLAQSAPNDARWLPQVAARLRETAAKLGIPAPAVAAASPAPAIPGPSAEQMRAANNLTPAEREFVIRGMVEGLAKKLKHNPNDLQGWLHLGHSYGVLGEWDKAQAAYRDGLHAFPGNADLTEALAKIPPVKSR